MALGKVLYRGERRIDKKIPPDFQLHLPKELKDECETGRKAIHVPERVQINFVEGKPGWNHANRKRHLRKFQLFNDDPSRLTLKRAIHQND
jgi:hypothetical protein